MRTLKIESHLVHSTLEALGLTFIQPFKDMKIAIEFNNELPIIGENLNKVYCSHLGDLLLTKAIDCVSEISEIHSSNWNQLSAEVKMELLDAVIEECKKNLRQSYYDYFLEIGNGAFNNMLLELPKASINKTIPEKLKQKAHLIATEYNQKSWKSYTVEDFSYFKVRMSTFEDLKHSIAEDAEKKALELFYEDSVEKILYLINELSKRIAQYELLGDLL